MMPRDERWLAEVVSRAETVTECQLAVSSYLADRLKMPLAPRFAGQPFLRLVGQKEPSAK